MYHTEVLAQSEQVMNNALTGTNMTVEIVANHLYELTIDEVLKRDGFGDSD